ncbi:hypothetical protein [Litorisediminicola beolgyonensis]|uniref:Uncharacterized protein n=1 Tax=Litorisediminicola beolgyonensis TaxID=1173614 RepID=A0ABW3ZHI9_9RHOB
MDLIDLLETARAEYVAVFEAAHAEQSTRFGEVIPEMAFRAGDGPFHGRVVVDLIGRSAGGDRAIAVLPPEAASVGPGAVEYAGLDVSVEALSWGAVRFEVAPTPVEIAGLGAWFDDWIDLEGGHQTEGALLSGVIHSVNVTSRGIEVDFGSAPVAAATELLALLSQSGVETVTIAGPKEAR